MADGTVGWGGTSPVGWECADLLVDGFGGTGGKDSELEEPASLDPVGLLVRPHPDGTRENRGRVETSVTAPPSSRSLEEAEMDKPLLLLADGFLPDTHRTSLTTPRNSTLQPAAFDSSNGCSGDEDGGAGEEAEGTFAMGVVVCATNA